MKKNWFLLSVMLIVVILAACSNSDNISEPGPDSSQSSENNGKDSLIVATKLEPSDYVINYKWNGAIPYINRNIFSKLVAYDAYSGELFGDLAEDWKQSDDVKTYTFDLRKDVTWHDGEPFTSADVKWTIESILEKGDSANGYPAVSNVDEIETPDDHTVVFHLKKESGVFVQKLADYQGFDILPKHLYEDTDVEENPYNKEPIGTGPFKYEEHQIGSHTKLVANEDYYGDGPYLDEIIFQYVPSEETALTSIEAGDAHAMTASPAFAEISRLEEAEGIEFKSDPQGIVQWISFNVDGSREYMSDPVVREAIATAIDNEEIAEKLYMGLVEPAESWYLSSIEWADNKSVRQPEHDVERANQLLDDAGYEKGDDGYRFTLTYRAFETSIFGTTDIPIFIQQQLEKVGIKVDYERFEWALRTEMLDERRDWDIAAGGGDRGPDPLFFASYLKSGSATNKMLYENSKVDELFELGEKAGTKDERAKYYFEIQEIIDEDIPMYNVVEYSIPRVFNENYTGFHWQENAVNSTNHMFNSVKKK
ncbi:ABC transporter substrate-binding protein [Virgibacillus halodenitrificans]|uniref:ABC transporter substrate-binding protein n=1 Tax=Virgibacillus halodenitrificans TaxID=1482 RepID=UPI00045D3B7B|nr:ABC transporter substrate-binding protein [Virgibacillus halodenitrificans]CDQ32068.1 Oligopeptide-binding protein AppA precursor [Virgibacillus halodenitrificans]